MEEFVNRTEVAKILGISKNLIYRYVKPISPSEGILFRTSDVLKAKKILDKTPLRRGRHKKVRQEPD